MSDFSFDFKLDTPVHVPTSQAFAEILRGVQAGMNRVAAEQWRVNDDLVKLRQENHALRSQNQEMRDNMARMSNGSVVGAAPAPVSAMGNNRSEGDDAFALERTIKIHDAPVHSVAMAPKRDFIATASWDSTVKLYNLATEEVTRTLGGQDQPGEENRMGGLYSVAFSKTQPDILGCTSCDRSVYLWNHATGRLLSKLTGHSDEVNGIDFHSSQQVMCTASDDCKAIIWDFQEGITLRTLDKHTKAVYGACFLGNQNQYYVATCCFDQMARIFDMRDKQIVAMLQQHTDDVIGIHYSEAKQLVATGSDDGTMSLWDTRTWKLMQTINTREIREENEVKRISFSPDGNLLAAACSSGQVLVYDVNDNGFQKRPTAVLGGHTDCVFDVTWGNCHHSNARILVSASHDRTCRYWRETC